MEIKLKDTIYDVDAKEIKTAIECVFKLEELTGNLRYGSDGVQHAVHETLVKAITMKVLDTDLVNEVVGRIDVEAIVKRVQLQVIQNIASAR